MTLAECLRMFRLVLAVALLSGCVGDLVELTPSVKRDLTTGPTVDLAEPPAGDDGGGGGADMAAPAPTFDPAIQADINTLGCAAAACHGNTQFPPLLVANAVAPADKQANYDNFKAKALMGELSTVLTKNLAGSGVAHVGGSSFANKNDAIYQRWLAWINAGHPQ